MDILGPLPKSRKENQFVLVITDRYYKQTRALSKSKTTALDLANLFLNHLIVPLGILTYLFTDHESQFGSMFLNRSVNDLE